MEKAYIYPLDGHSDFPPSVNKTDEIQPVLSRFFDLMFVAAVIFGGIALAASILRSWSHGWHSTLVLHVSMYLAALVTLMFRRRIPVHLLFAVMLGLMAISVMHSLVHLGLAGEGMMTLSVICIFSGVVFGLKAGIITAILGVSSVSLIGAGICTGWIATNSESQVHHAEPATWIIQIVSVLLYVVPLLCMINDMQRKMKKSLRDLREINERLQEEISARSTIETNLRKSEARFRNIFENAVEGIFQGTVDGQLLCVNPALSRMGRYGSPEHMIASVANINREFYVYPDERERARRLIERQGFIENFETQMFRHDRTTMWVSMNARFVHDQQKIPILIEGTIEDITQRKSAEKALYESELKYRSVVENALVGFYILQDDHFRFVNARFCAITGYSHEEIIDALSLVDITHKDDREKIENNPKYRLGEGTDYAEDEIRIIRKDGKTAIVRLMGGVAIYCDKPAVFGTCIDITHEKFLESNLIQSQKMEAIGIFSGGVAHDFNNILTAVMGYGTLLRNALEEGKPLRQYADHIIYASERGADLTRGLLSFSRVKPVARGPIDLNNVVQGTEKLLSRVLNEDILLETNLSPCQMTILADSTLMDQILFNLVINARDAMPEGGVIRITTEPVVLDEEFILTNGFGKTGEYALLSVSDNGKGMDAETLERIFDPFFTTKEIGKGTGLGLSTVYRIVKQHYGYVLVRSAFEQGTDFFVYLPLVEAGAMRVERIHDNYRGGGETILVAEDDIGVRSFIKDILNEYGYQVIEAIDGEDAIQKFVEHPEISLVVLDSIMPNRNGKKVYSAINSIRPGVYTLFMSGYEKDASMEQETMKQQIDFITKPVYPDEFLKRVGAMLDRLKTSTLQAGGFQG